MGFRFNTAVSDEFAQITRSEKYWKCSRKWKRGTLDDDGHVKS